MRHSPQSVMEAHEKRNVDTKVVGDIDQCCLVHPYSDFHNIWDLFMACLILLTVVTVPLGLGWEQINKGKGRDRRSMLVSYRQIVTAPYHTPTASPPPLSFLPQAQWVTSTW